MRILFNGWAVSNRGGIGRYTRNLASALSMFNTQHQLLLVSTDKRFSANLDTTLVNSEFSNRLFFELWQLPSICKKYNPDVIICPDFITCSYRKAKRVTVIHDLSPIILPASVSWKARTLFISGIKNTIKSADLIFADSFYTKQSINQYFPNSTSKIEVLYPSLEPVYLQHYSFIPLEKRQNRIMWVGDSGIRKDVETLIKAFTCFVSKNPDFRLLYIGSIKEEYKRLSWLDHKQNISDNELINYYRNSKCLVNTSLFEGFGYPVAEALSQGTPCVVTNSSSMQEISPIGIRGFQPGDYENCAQLISETVNDTKINSDTIARQILEQPFDYKSTANQIFMAINQI